jgi:hypothetical protein
VSRDAVARPPGHQHLLVAGPSPSRDQRLEGGLQPAPTTQLARLPSPSGLRCRLHPPMNDFHQPWISSRGPATVVSSCQPAAPGPAATTHTRRRPAEQRQPWRPGQRPGPSPLACPGSAATRTHQRRARPHQAPTRTPTRSTHSPPQPTHTHANPLTPSANSHTTAANSASTGVDSPAPRADCLPSRADFRRRVDPSARSCRPCKVTRAQSSAASGPCRAGGFADRQVRR